MENISSAAKALCGVSAGICLVEMLAGDTKLKGQLRMILDLLLALVIIAPFVKGGLSLELPRLNSADLGEYSYSQELYLSEMKARSEENIASVLREQIAAAGISCQDIRVEVNISDELCISISKVVLTSEDPQSAAVVVKSSLGREVVIEYGDS